MVSVTCYLPWICLQAFLLLLLCEYRAQETAQCLLAEFYYGDPKAVLSDQGLIFLSKVLSFLYERLAVMKICTNPYNHETNGQLERFHSS